jgi:formate dehydrogenase-N alpha subunit
MTNHWIDIRNSDRILIIGSNAAENHPISFRWITEAMSRGGKLINVDPRFTRTSSKADIYAPMRSGCDITFIGGMIRYILNDMQRLGPAGRTEKYNMTYVTQYTNAALIIDDAFEGASSSNHPGLFSGYTPKNGDGPGRLGGYDKSSWFYAGKSTPASDPALVNNTWNTWEDLNPKCVLRLLWENFKDYDEAKVEEVTGCPKDTFLTVAETYAESGKTGRAGTIMYAMGTTQHTYGTQNIRGYAILQLLLANVGIAGGGINALRGTSNVQGSTDMCLLWHILPGYLDVPTNTDQSLDDYIARAKKGKDFITPQGLAGDKTASWWWYNDDDPNYKKYIVSLLKAWWGNNATAANDFRFEYLPKVTSGGDYSHIAIFEAAAAGIVKGMMTWGQNPAVGGPDSEGERKALEKLDWLVVTDLFETETAAFWYRDGANHATIDTEVFLLPAACSYEKQGSISNSGRWAQWRWKALDPIGQAKPDLEIIDELALKLKELYATEGGVFSEAITNLFWDYREGAAEADPNVAAKEFNGYVWDTGEALTSFGNLKSDGSTCSGNWLYCGMYDADGNNKAKQHDPVDRSLNQIGLYSGWTWCWPINRRIIYNRASVDLDGQPWDEEHPVIQRENGKWLGDVADGGWAAINEAEAGSKFLPFIMHREGVGKIWGYGRAEGPVPVAYEPWESPLDKNLVTNVANDKTGRGAPGFNDPCCYVGQMDMNGESWNKRGTSNEFPYVGTTYRLTEHWQAGQMTRNLPWLVELQPQPIAELDKDLAASKGIKNGDIVEVSVARGAIQAVAIVTDRFQPLLIGGKKVHQIGVPWHWGYTGYSTGISPNGSSGNVLTPHVGDANTTIPEYKTFLCNVRKV